MERQKLLEMDSGEKRLNELGYKQELRREMTLFKTLAISVSTISLFTGITPLFGASLQYAGPASLVWGWVIVCFFTWFVGVAMSEICSSFPIVIMVKCVDASQNKKSEYHFKDWTLEGVMIQIDYRLSILLGCTFSWAEMGPFASWCCAWFETIGLVAYRTQAYAGTEVLQSIILLCTGTNKGGGYFAPKWLFLSMYIVQTLIWAVLNTFALEVIAFIDTVSVWWQDLSYLYDPNNETAGAFVPAQILTMHFMEDIIMLLEQFCFFSSYGIIFLCRAFDHYQCSQSVYALSRDGGVPYSSIWRKVHPKHKVPANAVWLCSALCILLGLPILKLNVVFTAITSICTIGWVGGYAVPIFARMVMAEENFNPGPFYLGRASRPVCFIAFVWICYTCVVFLLPTYYPITWNSFNYAPAALAVVLGLIMLWWVVDARKWFKGPVRNIDGQNDKV
ncbi:Amino-acid permease BAT1-like protein [Bienertia sinuspersici]